jgi:hypothetical protein
MPPDIREAYQRVLAQLAATAPNRLPGNSMFRNTIEVEHTSITINGKTYGSRHEMPPDVRQAYDDAIRQIDGNRNGVPDVLEQTGSAALASASAVERLPSTLVISSASARLPNRDGGKASTPFGSLVLALLGAAFATLLFWWWQR